MEQFGQGDYPSTSENKKIEKDFENAKKAVDNLNQGGGVFRNDQEEGALYTKLSDERLNYNESMKTIKNDLLNAVKLIPHTEEQAEEIADEFFRDALLHIKYKEVKEKELEGSSHFDIENHFLGYRFLNDKGEALPEAFTSLVKEEIAKGYVKFDGENTEFNKDIYPGVKDFIRTVQARLYA